MIRLLCVHFDAGEEPVGASFEIDEPVQALIISSLGSFTPAYREFGHLMIDLSLSQMRRIYNDLGNRRSPTADVSETAGRVSRVLEMTTED